MSRPHIENLIVDYRQLYQAWQAFRQLKRIAAPLYPELQEESINCLDIRLTTSGPRIVEAGWLQHLGLASRLDAQHKLNTELWRRAYYDRCLTKPVEHMQLYRQVFSDLWEEGSWLYTQAHSLRQFIPPAKLVRSRKDFPALGVNHYDMLRSLGWEARKNLLLKGDNKSTMFGGAYELNSCRWTTDIECLFARAPKILLQQYITPTQTVVDLEFGGYTVYQVPAEFTVRLYGSHMPISCTAYVIADYNQQHVHTQIPLPIGDLA